MSTAEANAAYLAGIIDGEGSFGMYGATGSKYIYPRCTIGSKDEVLIAGIQKIAGSFGIRFTPSRRKCGFFTLVLQKGAELAVLLDRVLPYLILKRPQAGICKAYIACNRNWKPGTRKHGFPEGMARLIEKLNQRTILSQPPSDGGGAETISGPERDGIVQPAAWHPPVVPDRSHHAGHRARRNVHSARLPGGQADEGVSH